MIEVQNLRKVYGDTVAVDDVSFVVPAGEILGFLGPNGAGKTTTMRVLTGYTPATGGRASIAGFDTTEQSRQVRAILGYLPENAPVYDEMTVEGFVGFFAEVKGFAGAAKRSVVGRALDECGLEKVGGRLLMNLSKGYRQRAALAQAVVGDPKVLILDEPTIGLDPAQIRGIRSLIRRMAERRTVILSTHILPEVSLTCTRVVIINQGRVLADGTPESIRGTVKHPNDLVIVAGGPQAEVAKLIGEQPHVSHVRHHPHAASASAGSRPEANEYEITVKDGADVRSDLAREIIGAGHDLLEMRSTGLSLEDVFIHLIASGEEEKAREASDA